MGGRNHLGGMRRVPRSAQRIHYTAGLLGPGAGGGQRPVPGHRQPLPQRGAPAGERGGAGEARLRHRAPGEAPGRPRPDGGGRGGGLPPLLSGGELRRRAPARRAEYPAHHLLHQRLRPGPEHQLRRLLPLPRPQRPAPPGGPRALHRRRGGACAPALRHPGGAGHPGGADGSRRSRRGGALPEPGAVAGRAAWGAEERCLRLPAAAGRLRPGRVHPHHPF